MLTGDRTYSGSAPSFSYVLGSLEIFAQARFLEALVNSLDIRMGRAQACIVVCGTVTCGSNLIAVSSARYERG